MNILILGSGGREHALAWKIGQSPLCKNLFVAPGNPGTAQIATNVSIALNEFEGIGKFCIEQHIDMLIVGPEDPLVNGIFDYFMQTESLNHIHVIGPSSEGAKLEGSKAFAKQFMQDFNIPTASYKEFNNETYYEGIQYIKQHSLPIVLKADGLAAGKGVVICETYQEALLNFESMIKKNKFGKAGTTVVIEQFLKGIESSCFILTDGEHYCLLPSAKDYKRIGEGDTGLNTGGMGAISPVPFIDNEFEQKIIHKIIEPTILGLKQKNIIYKGFIFIGLIKVDNEPYVIEYNCRMGDPETEVVMPRIENDLVPLLYSLKSNQLNSHKCIHTTKHASTVVLVSKGYPEDYEKGKQISHIQDIENSIVFHAGTKDVNGELLTNGGRVLAITSIGNNLKDALDTSFDNAMKIDFEGKYFRKDIGWEFTT